MARRYASIALRIWTDDNFRALTQQAQWLYMRLISDTKLSLAGVADWRPRRIVASASGLSGTDVEKACSELEHRSFIVLDEDTEEVCVRSFMRNDKTLRSVTTAKGVVSALEQVESPKIRGVLSHELHRLKGESDTPSGLHLATEFMERNTPSPHTPKGVLDGASEGVSGGGFQDCAPKPKPKPEPKPEPEPGAHFASESAEPNAQTLIGEWIDNCKERPPGKVIGQLSREIKTLLDEGHSYQQVRSAVQEWNQRGLHPSTLASVLHEIRNKRTQPRQTAAEREMQIAADRHQRIESGQFNIGQRLDDAQLWGQTPTQIER